MTVANKPKKQSYRQMLTARNCPDIAHAAEFCGVSFKGYLREYIHLVKQQDIPDWAGVLPKIKRLKRARRRSKKLSGRKGR